MKVALVAIAKNENEYLVEWCQWYKDLGIEKIYIYDNNNIDGEHPQDVLSDFINDGFVEIVDWRGKRGDSRKEYSGCSVQGLAYTDWWNKWHNLYDWCCIFDIDEFLLLIKYKTLDAFLSKYSEVTEVKVQWIVYGDNGNIHKTTGGVRERFNSFTNAHKSKQIKSILNCKKKINPKFHAHGLLDVSDAVNTLGVKVRCVWKDCTTFDNLPAYLEHYITKSTEEYLNRKWKQPDALRGDINHNKEFIKKRYFKYNTKTNQKEEFFDSFCK